MSSKRATTYRIRALSTNKVEVQLPSGLKAVLTSQQQELALDTPLGLTEALRRVYREVLSMNTWIWPGVYARQWMARKVGDQVEGFLRQASSTGELSPLFLVLLRVYRVVVDGRRIELTYPDPAILETMAQAVLGRVRTRTEARPHDVLGLWREHTLMVLGRMGALDEETPAALDAIRDRLVAAAQDAVSQQHVVVSGMASPADLVGLYSDQESSQIELLDTDAVGRLSAEFIKLAQDRLEQEKGDVRLVLK